MHSNSCGRVVPGGRGLRSACRCTHSAGAVSPGAVVISCVGLPDERRAEGEGQGAQSLVGGRAYGGDLARHALRLLLEDVGARLLGLTFGLACTATPNLTDRPLAEGSGNRCLCPPSVCDVSPPSEQG
jgi:hypothetical protein